MTGFVLGIVLALLFVVGSAAQGKGWKLHLRCQLESGEVVLLYIPDHGGIGGAHEACYALGGKPKGLVR